MRLSNTSQEKTRDKIRHKNMGRVKGKRGTSSAMQVLLQKMGQPMKWDQVSQNWDEFKPQVKKQWSKITDHELVLCAGDHDELRRHISQSYNISREEAEGQMKEFLISINS